MASELCMNCFSVKGQYEVCPFCGYAEGTPTEQPHYLTPGTILANHFIIGTVIGFGGFGITYKAYDTTLGVIVAVKEFYPAGHVNRAPGENMVGLLSGEKQGQYRMQLKRFMMEAQSIARFGKAKDIVNVYDFFEANNTAYIIMEYVEGVLLKDYLDKQGRMDVDVAISVITPIVDAVKKIHAQGIIHRDISPDNIFIDGEESIKVFDFGAAQLNDSSEGKAGEKVIKVGYSAPEQYRDKSRQGFYTDIYSVGAILYQMVTGIKPMESTEREYRDELRSPLELGVRIEPNIDRAIMEALAVKPELRFQGIQQLEDALHSKRIAEYPKDKLKKRKRRRNWMISGAAAVVLAVGVSFALFNTVLKPKNEMMDAVLEKDSITIWVDSPDTKAKLEEVKAKNFTMTEGSDSGEVQEKTKEILKDNEKIEVNIVDVSAEDGSAGVRGRTMDEALQAAKEQGSMPDMFLTDRVSSLDQYELASMEDTVYQAIEPEEYLYMSEYEKYFRDMKEMPTGLDSLFLYAYSISPHTPNTALQNRMLDTSRFIREAGDSSTVELTQIFEKNQPAIQNQEDFRPASEEREYTQALCPYLMYAGILQYGDSFFRSSTGELSPNGDLVDFLGANYTSLYLNPVWKEGKNNAKTSDEMRKTKMFGNSSLGGVGRRKELSRLKSEGSQSGDTESTNHMKDYQIFAVTHQGKMPVIYSERYAVSGTSSKNRQLACMRFLWIMLGEPAQAGNFKGDGDLAFPINAQSFGEFFKYNPKYKCFQSLVDRKNPCLIIGRGTGDVCRFEKGILSHCIASKNPNVLSADSAKEYCSAYVEGNGK